jgi:hypothetical protein
MPPNRALDAAIALSRVPSLAVAMRSQALPTGVKLLLRIALHGYTRERRLENQTDVTTDQSSDDFQSNGPKTAVII